MWQLQTKTEMRSCFDSNDCTYAAVGKGLKRVTPILMPPFLEERRVCASSGRTLNICSRMKHVIWHFSRVRSLPYSQGSVRGRT